MKYKVGDKTLLGEITIADETDPIESYLVKHSEVEYWWFGEQQIDKIIIKPKRNIDHIIELWESGKEEAAGRLFEDCTMVCDGYESNDDIRCLLAPYVEPSKYPNLNPEERKALELVKACGFNWMCRICDFISIGETKEAADFEDGIRSSWIPSLSILDGAKWLTSEPINLKELLDAQEDI